VLTAYLPSVRPLARSVPLRLNSQHSWNLLHNPDRLALCHVTIQSVGYAWQLPHRCRRQCKRHMRKSAHMLPGSSRLYSQTLGNVAAESAGGSQTSPCENATQIVRCYHFGGPLKTGCEEFALSFQQSHHLPTLRDGADTRPHWPKELGICGPRWNRELRQA
jgi:hypothetical protein